MDVVERDYTEAATKYTNLHPPRSREGVWSIEGTIEVVDGNDFAWDSYEITILFPCHYPEDLPILLETGQKIQRLPEWEWHVNSRGECCLDTTAGQYRKLVDGISLLKWLDRLVIPFLANHIHRIEIGYYANGEFSHGINGILEDYSALFGIQDINKIIYRLKAMIGIDLQGRNSPCFCGSGKLYKRCYELNQDQHRMGIPALVIAHDIKALRVLDQKLRS